MAGVEQGNVSKEELMSKEMSAFTAVTVKISTTKTKKLTAEKKNLEEI